MRKLSENEVESLLRETGHAWKISALEAETQRLAEHKRQVLEAVRLYAEHQAGRSKERRPFISLGDRSLTQHFAFACVFLLAVAVTVRYSMDRHQGLPRQTANVAEANSPLFGEEGEDSRSVDDEASSAYAAIEVNLQGNVDASSDTDSIEGEISEDSDDSSDAFYPEYTSLAFDLEASDFEEGDSDENESS